MRLSGSTGSDDAASAIDAAVQEAVVGMADRLGDDLVAEILASPYTETPTTASQRRRVKASLIEQKWARMVLMRTMPVLFQQGVAQGEARWNQEEFETDRVFTEREISRLYDDVLAGLDELTDGANRPTGSASVIGPDVTPVYRPGFSARHTATGGLY